MITKAVGTHPYVSCKTAIPDLTIPGKNLNNRVNINLVTFYFITTNDQ